MRQVPRSPLSFKLQRVANVPAHPPPSTRLMSCAHIANRRLSRIIGASWRGRIRTGYTGSSEDHVKYFTENRVPLRARKESPSCPGRVRAYAWGVDARPCPTSRRQPRSRGSIPELHGKALTISCASASGSWGLGRNWATFLPRQRRSKRSLSTRRTYHTLFAVSL